MFKRRDAEASVFKQAALQHHQVRIGLELLGNALDALAAARQIQEFLIVDQQRDREYIGLVFGAVVQVNDIRILYEAVFG